MNLIQEKNKKIMIKGIRKVTFALLLMLPFSSCISENETEPAPQIPEEAENVLRVMIPRYLDFESETKTKAGVEVPASKEEATIDKLWFFAYPVAGSDNTEAQTFIKEISDDKTSQKETDATVPNTDYTGYEDYAAYDVKGIRKGTYHIYVVANLEKYISGTTLNESITESTLQNFLLNFGSDTYTNEITEKTIPMACYYTDICKKTGTGDPTKVASGEFTFNGNADEVVYADMTMLCSKVRYTILFDMDTFSDTFPENTVDFNSAVPIKNIYPTTSLAPATTSPTTVLLTANGILSPVYYPGDAKNEGNHTDWYLNITQEREGEVKAPENLTKIPDEGTWTDPDQRAWQGIIYLPENLATEPTGEAADTRTTLEFNPTTETELLDGKKVALTLVRGNFYDVVGKLQTPLRIDFYISVKIQILAWAKRNIYVGW